MAEEEQVRFCSFFFFFETLVVSASWLGVGISDLRGFDLGEKLGFWVGFSFEERAELGVGIWGLVEIGL